MLSPVVAILGLLAATAPSLEGDVLRLCGRDWPVDASEVTCEGSPFSSTLDEGRLPEVLARFSQLESLTLKRLTLRDCTVLGRLPYLRALNLVRTKVEDPACLGAPITLERLGLRDATVTGIEPLALLTRLKVLQLPVEITDLSAL
ncbi:MAG: hypothetical protein QF464_02075, partial [Myxococcota bacterium]|nr:hypothetical protein [Myxococcota bacterium]